MIDTGAMSTEDSAKLLALLSEGQITVEQAEEGIKHFQSLGFSVSGVEEGLKRIPPLSQEEELLIALRLQRRNKVGQLFRHLWEGIKGKWPTINK